MLMAILAVHGVEVHPLVEPHFHTSFNDCSHTVDVCRIVDSNVLNVTAFGKVETLKLSVLLFERRDVFANVTMERVSVVLGNLDGSFVFTNRIQVLSDLD